MTTTMGSLVVNLEANIARFTNDMQRASQQTEQAMNKINGALNVTKGAVAALGAGISLGAIVSETNKVLDSLAALDDMAQKTGSSVETLSKLGKVAAFTGTEFGAVDSMLVKLSKNLASTDEEGNKTAKALAAIGISTADLKSKDPAQLFVDITNKLQNYQDGAGKVALVTDLMGKSAADMLPFMNDVAESIDKFQAESKEAAAQAAAFQDQLGLLKVKYSDLTTSIVVGALPAANAFIGALTETKREANALTTNTAVSTWADDVAIGLARVADRAKLVVGTLGAVAGSVKVVATDIEALAKASPAYMAVQVAKGKDPLEDFRATMAERDKIIADANAKWSRLLDAPINAFEEGTIKRIAEQKNAMGLLTLGGMVGLKDIGLSRTLDYGSDEKAGGKSKGAPVTDLAPAVARMRESAPDPSIGARMIEQANNEAFAVQNVIQTTLDLEDATQRRIDQSIRAADQNSANVEQIRQSLMSQVEYEQFSHDSRMEQLRIYGENKMESEMAVNAWMEQETARHKAVIAAMDQEEADRKMYYQMQVMQQAGGVADQMYSILEKAGKEQSALGKAAFLASKGLAVAQIIMSTNAAAAAAVAPVAMGGLGPVAGLGLAATIKALGYSSAAMTAGLAIAEASAEGGYDIPAGINPVTQLHEKEMVLPKRQADVIRGLADGSVFGGSRGAVTINYSPQIHIDGETDMEKNRKLISMAVSQGNADLVDRLQRAGRI